MPDDKTHIPQKFWFSKQLGKNSIRQLQYPAVNLDRTKHSLEPGSELRLHSKQILVSRSRPAEVPAGFDDVLITTEGVHFAWLRKNEIPEPKWTTVFSRRELATANLKNRFKFIEEERNVDHSITKPGLRSPQIGAIYAALGHWKMSSEVATVVLPTGTGKTDSMVALMALQQPRCLLVVVPTDALRTQLAEKFMTLGVLTQYGLLPSDTLYPVVGLLKTGLESISEIQVFCDACNVIVTTVPLLSKFTDTNQKALASRCSCLFIDEAHHSTATTWNRLRSRFSGKPILQFTATPYRNDGQHIDGRVIFNYPLRKAQEEGYFTKIVLKELWDYVEIDESVAKAAVDQLLTDLSHGLDHFVMARAASITRAESLKKVYDDLAQDLLPVVVHSDLTKKELKERMDQLYSRKSRIAICVSMFGEGFDFPELKIAALHDIHQSLAVTIQFTGRFARSNPKVGDATIIVNRADDTVDESVRDLYAQGGGAGNLILRRLTEGATRNQIARQDFYESFAEDSQPVSIQNISPKMSTVVYRSTINKWMPFKIVDLPIAKSIVGQLSISRKEDTAFFITSTSSPVEWADSTDLINQTYDLYALFWDAKTHLLYINSSNNDSLHEDLAKAVGGPDAELINGIDAFRVLHGLKRLLLRNMGLNDHLRRSVRFVMYTGSDIRAYVESSQTQGKEKTHVFGDGFDGKSRITIGTSKKGRIWSWQEARDLLEWKKWCIAVGEKLVDKAIVPDSFLQDSLVPTDISGPPDLYPLTIEWPDELYQRTEESIFIGSGEASAPFFEVGIELVDPTPAKPLRFKVFTEDFSASYEMKFSPDKVTYLPDVADLSIKLGKKVLPLSEFLGRWHPIIRYEKDCFVRGDQLLTLRERSRYSFNSQTIVSWDWNGVDLTNESQTIHKRMNSIQRRTIDNVLSADWGRDYQLVFDDDAPGEVADVVCLSTSDTKLLVDLFHCKHSRPTPGSRTKDLYEVCGQAQRSIKWQDDIDRFLLHLINREKFRMKKHKVSRLEHGDFKRLIEMRSEAKALLPEFRIFIVQPGISKSQVSDDQQELLGATKLYLHETRGIEFSVIGSE